MQAKMTSVREARMQTVREIVEQDEKKAIAEAVENCFQTFPVVMLSDVPHKRYPIDHDNTFELNYPIHMCSKEYVADQLKKAFEALPGSWKIVIGESNISDDVNTVKITYYVSLNGSLIPLGSEEDKLFEMKDLKAKQMLTQLTGKIEELRQRINSTIANSYTTYAKELFLKGFVLHMHDVYLNIPHTVSDEEIEKEVNKLNSHGIKALPHYNNFGGRLDAISAKIYPEAFAP